MTFRTFIDAHMPLDGFDDLQDADVNVLHAIELARRHPGSNNPESLLRAAETELGRVDLPSAVRAAIACLWGLYEAFEKAGTNAPNGLTEPRERSIASPTSATKRESDVATTEIVMSLEDKIEKLTAAVETLTKTLSDKGSAPATVADKKDEPAKEERRSRRDRSEPAGDKGKGPTQEEVKSTVAKFLEQPDTKDGDDEYNARLEKVIDPIFEKAGVKELSDLPEKNWQDLLDAIAEYTKPKEEGRRSRRS